MLTKAQLKRRIRKIYAFFLRINLKNRDFTIISNNCWGGRIYDKYALPYKTPTIGLWIPPSDYVKFLENMEQYLKIELKQINYTESHVRDLLVANKETGRCNLELDKMIIGRLGDIDIIFLHYNSFDDAKEKWNRRKKRINKNNILVKMNDQNNCSEEDIKKFLLLDYENKLFFTANKDWKYSDDVVFIEKYQQDGYVVSDTMFGDVPLNTTQILNNMKRCVN